ncbi:MAG: SiaB family protein kinase [Salinivirgaceae bacterium]|nr:SiaB family protein kinase [Salinivirgaceae bacterium]
MALEIDDWYNEHVKDGVIFAFRGEIGDGIVEDSMVRVEAQTKDLSQGIKKKAYNIMVECLQNLFFHASPIFRNGKEIRIGVCAMVSDGNSYHIKMCNYATQKQTLFLEKHIEKINSLDKDGLRAFYKDVLSNQTFSEKGGGGLGLIDMARKSSNKLKCEFIQVPDNMTLFSTDILITE